MDLDANILVSNYKKYPSSFDINKLKIQVYSSHDTSYNFGKFVPRIETINGVQYIGIYNERGISSDQIFRRSSFGWTLKITLQKDYGGYEEKLVDLQYNPNDLKISPYKACFHDLDISKTYLDMPETIGISIGTESKMGKVELRTTDNYLYNYDIGKENVQVVLENGGNQVTFRIEPYTIKGIYEIYGKTNSAFQGTMIIKVKGKEVGRRRLSGEKRFACYLEYVQPELFKYLKSDFKDHYYEYLGDFNDGHLQFWFRVYDRYWNEMFNEDYKSCFADVYSHQFGNDETKFYTILYKDQLSSYEFLDKLNFQSKQYTWVFFMRDSTCNNKYYITYDSSRIQASISVKNSYYTLLSNYLNVNELSYVDVFLKDSSLRFIGTTSGRLQEVKSRVVVKARDTSTNDIYEYEFDQITNNYGIRFKRAFEEPGDYEVTAYYINQTLPCTSSKYLKVVSPRFSLEHSRLFMIVDSIIEMNTQVKTAIKNAEQIPYYKLMLYTANGAQTNYDSNSKFTCKMTGLGVTLDLDVSPKTDYIQFSYKESDHERFKSLKKGDYTLTVTASYSGKDADKESKDYPLYLYGDGDDDTSNDPNIDYSKTLIEPTHIDGYAGKQYTINLEFRAKDGFRWNYWTDINLFSFENSYGLTSKDFITKVTQGYKKGQYFITVQQNTVTKPGNDNILTIIHDNNKIPQTVSLTIKAGDFAKIILVDGPTKGNVINHPILTFKPVDQYGNQYTFDPYVSQEYLNSLTVGRSLDGVPLTTNNYLYDGLLKVQYKTTISTNVKVTSPYFEEKYAKDIGITYRIRSGPIDPETSYAEMQATNEQTAGSNYTIIIYPKDMYYNDIDDLNVDDMKKFLTYYQVVETKEKVTVTDCKLAEGYSSAIDIIIRKLMETEQEEENLYDSIECITPINTVGNIEFHVEYVEDEIECRNCVFSIIASKFDFSKTKTMYKNKGYYLQVDKLNEVDAEKDPIFELTFYDQFSNLITDTEFVEELDIDVTFEGYDIKLCVSNSGYRKLATLCPSTNGDDNMNKWQYITNGEHYKLVVQQRSVSANVIKYPIKITKGGTGSNKPEAFNETYLYPTELKIQAGEEAKTMMEIRTADKDRKNYWYPDIGDKIKVKFNKDENSCSYSVEKSNLPGQYDITVSCTKANDDNSFTVIVDSNVIKPDVKLIVTCGPAYSLEAEEKDKFIISGYKHTWKNSLTNDDDINFLFKLYDKYDNLIKTSVIGTSQMSISSELFGTNGLYYGLEFNDKNSDYLFTHKIYTYVPKHTWNILITESQRKYSFIYNRVPGKVDPSKSYWTIDKTEYILKETSTVLVTLCDRYGVNVGIVEGRLLKEKDYVNVTTNNGKDISYNYNSITDDNQIKYKYQYIVIGQYEVRVTYDGKQIGDRVNVTVIYQKIDPKTSKLYYVIENDELNLMYPKVQTNIDNLKYCPYYILHLYTKDGERITVYDKKIDVKATMVLNEDSSWELDVDKRDDHIYLAPKDCETDFHKLPKALYHLKVKVDDEIVDYPLFLIGEEDVCPYADFTSIYINPTFINGIAGFEYKVDLEFRCKDGLRWNYEVNINSMTFKNSYGLKEKDLVIKKEIGDKNGQMRLYITQYVATTKGKDNIIYLEYEKKQVTQHITLRIKCHPDLMELEYHSGAVDGTVINPSIVKFIPRDKYGNLYTDLFNETLYPKERLEKLTQGVSEEKYDLTTNNYVTEAQDFLYVQYGCRKVTTIRLTAKGYNPNTYRYKLWSGPIDPDTSYAKIEKTDNVRAGDPTKLTIYPRDKYENNVTNATKDDLAKFDVDYEVDNDYKKDISDTCETTNFIDDFDCNTKVTKAGVVEFTVEYDDKTVKCLNCVFDISPGPIDFSKTKVYNKNENKEMSKTELNILPVTIKPKFSLHFFDQYLNPIKDEKEVEALNVTTDIVVTDVKLCVSNHGLIKLSELCKSQNNDENEEKWSFLPNGDNYKLIATEQTKKEQLTFPVKLIGGFTCEDDDCDSEPVDDVYLNPQELTLMAGEEDIVFMELRTANNKRKNYWYTDVDNNIKIEFPSENKGNCTYSLSRADLPGQYNIKFKCYKTIERQQADVKVENKLVPKPIYIKVIANAPFTSKLFTMSREEITKPYLGSVSVEDQFQMINILYDKYENQITDIQFDLAILQIKMAPANFSKVHQWSVDLAPQSNGEILITLKSTYAIEHYVVGKYFPLEKYTIIFTPGEPNADNSELEVSDTEKYVGETVKIFITPKDRYNNIIDASQFKDVSPYQVKYTNKADTTRVITKKHEIEERNGHKVLSYDAIFYIRGMTYVSGYIDTQPIKCISCTVNVLARDIDLYNAFRYESTRNAFEPLRNGTVENNTKEEPIYRLYPKDQYGNDIETIPEEDLVAFTAYLKSQKEGITYKLRLNNNETKDQEYAEFTTDDSIQEGSYTYKTLVEGYYDLIFTNGKNRLAFVIKLVSQAGSNEEVDPENTYVIDENLKYVAGKTGYMMLELRTESGLRKNYWEGYTFTVKSSDTSDDSFDFVQEKAGTLGVFLITVTSKKANTYPKKRKVTLDIFLNGVEIKSYKPEMEVYPDEVVRTVILDKYYKDKSNNTLLDGIAGQNYVFEVASYDQYDNLAETIQEVVGLKIALRGGDLVNKTTSLTNQETGFRKYNVPVTKAGTYVVYTDKSGPKGLYLQPEAIFEVLPGEIDLSKTIIKAKSTPIQAGTKPGITLEAFDHYGNPLPPDSYIDKFTAEFTDSQKNKHPSTGSFDDILQTVVYISNTPVTVIGLVRVKVVYNKKDLLDTSHVIIEVIPGDVDPSKSILSRKTINGIEQYKNESSFTVDTNELLILNVTLYDQYNNYISQIPADVDIVKPTMSGNDMTEILFKVYNLDSYFDLDFNDNEEYLSVYQSLAKGTYDLTYKVNTSSAEASFIYNINVEGDPNHGNGPIEKCILTPKNTSFIAGNYKDFNLEFRTKEGKLYNGEIDIDNDLLVEIAKDDKSFNYTITKIEKGNYTVTIYSHVKGKNTLKVLFLKYKNSKGEDIKDDAEYYVHPDRVPCKNFTVINNPQEFDVPADSNFEISFTLADKFNNSFEGRTDIIDNNYLILLNNREPMDIVSQSMNDEDVYKLIIYPKYPPKTMYLNVLYKDEDNSVDCFMEDLIVNVITGIDLHNTLIVSKNKERIYVGEYLDMQLYTLDKKGECFDDGKDYSDSYKVVVTGPMDSEKQSTVTYDVNKTGGGMEEECNNEYEIIIDEEKHKYKYAGNYVIKVYSNDELIAHYDQVCIAKDYVLFFLDCEFDPNYIPVYETARFTITGTDEYFNKIENAPLIDDITIDLSINGVMVNKDQYEKEKYEVIPGELHYSLDVHKAGKYQLHMYYKGNEVTVVNIDEPLPILNFVAGPCYAEDNSNFDLSTVDGIVTEKQEYFKFQCYDKFNNKITKGGEDFSVTAHISLDSDDFVELNNVKIKDNYDGTYTISFIPNYPGTYVFNIFNNNEKYGQDVSLLFGTKECKGTTPILCPDNRCVANAYQCIDPPNGCDIDTPFKCKVNGTETCVKSQIDCDCPEGYIRCDYMRYCVREDRPDMCPLYKQNRCQKDYLYFPDGICRPKDHIPPNQIVCPIGYVLCPDLTCRKDHSLCELSEELKSNEVRCVEQSIKKTNEECPSIVSCDDPNKVVCSNTRQCVNNEIECPKLTECSHHLPFLCAPDWCAYKSSMCPKAKACGEGNSMCWDQICRTSCFG